MARTSPRSRKISAGYTLVELMVAASCLGIAISGVLSMIGGGRKVEVENANRRQARMYALSAMESDAIHYSNYAGAISTSGTVVLNPGTAMATTANLIVNVTPLSVNWNNPIGVTPSQISVPYKSIKVQVNWTVGGRTDSVYAQKRIAELR